MNKQTQAAAQAASSTDLQTLLGDGLARRWWQSITLWLGLLAVAAVSSGWLQLLPVSIPWTTPPFLSGWLLTGYFTRPLRAISQAADHLSAGQIGTIPSLDSPREIAVLSQSIRQLVESLTHQQSVLGMLDDKAHSDPLTGLANRAALERFLLLAKHRESALGLLYLDLDGFKPVNDSLGHAAGDQLLKHVAVRLRGCLRDGDMVARLGGDEFVMVLRMGEGKEPERVRLVAERVLHGLRQPVLIDGQEAHIGCSIGAALWPQDHAELDGALELADQALYRAKHNGRNRVEFHSPG